MSVLVGGIAGASSRLGGGLNAVGPSMVSDVTPTVLSGRGPSIGPRLGHFRRVLTDLTVDGVGSPVADTRVRVFRASDDVKVADVVSDAAGRYAAYLYADGPFYAVAIYDAQVPAVVGTTDRSLTGA